MKLFSGFPSGKVSVTPLPNLFFTELAPAIDDLAELRVTLHLMWRMANQNAKSLCVSARDLTGDATLMQSLAANGASAEDALERALEKAVERGSLLRWQDANDTWYFVNSDAGRRAYERAAQAAAPQPRVAALEKADAKSRPNIFALYEQNMGMLTPMLADELKAAEKDFPAAWIAEAIQIAVKNNKRSWSYARKILDRWKTEGRSMKERPGKSWFYEHRKYHNR
ncbi:MAG: DnaD domain protein [Chloroflexi bacterium]|nr:DnaD domain protein [Chloroflexota bacterium]